MTKLRRRPVSVSGLDIYIHIYIYIYIKLANDNDYAPEYPGVWLEQRKKVTYISKLTKELPRTSSDGELTGYQRDKLIKRL